MRVRLKDIAQELGVSVNTVSRALRGGADISEAMRQRVFAIAKQLDYQPNLMARSLVTGQSAILGLIVPDLLNPFFAELARSIGAALRKRSNDLILASSEEDPRIEQAEIRAMMARGVDALLISSCQPSLKSFYQRHNQRTPMVLVDRPFPELRANFVGCDDYVGGKLATEHLITIGRKRIAYIGSPDLGPAADRFRGFRSTMHDHGLEIRGSYVLSSPIGQKSDDDAGYTMMRQILKGRSKPNGVFCHNDVVAIGAMKAALEAGFCVPDDIAFVGFDNVHYSRHLQIPLTSIDQHSTEIGEAAAQLALDLATQKVRETSKILLTPTLVIRQSTMGKASSAIGSDGPIRPRRSRVPQVSPC